ncbi:MAG: hypothetical protein ACRCZJ_03670 [Erysipelotrichaceae bacterium]
MLSTFVLGKCITCKWTYLGDDLHINLYGGDKAHIGCCVVGQYYTRDEKDYASLSTINLLGHREEMIAQEMVEALVKKTKHTVSCCCGIHYDEVSKEQLKVVSEALHHFIEQCIEEIIRGNANV